MASDGGAAGATGGGARDPLDDVAVVVPVAPGDEAWRALLADLAMLPATTEIVFAAAAPLDAAAARAANAALGETRWTWHAGPRGRARQLNAAVPITTREHIWFLHADSRFTASTLDRMRSALRKRPDALLFSDLGFLDDGPRLMRLNALGVRLRSRWLGMPFGDQGLCVRREVWARLGGFDEGAPYGEDHLFVWRARRAGVPLHATGGVLLTSARRYRDHGWRRTTLRHLRLTARQALPEWLALLRAGMRARRGAPREGSRGG